MYFLRLTLSVLIIFFTALEGVSSTLKPVFKKVLVVAGSKNVSISHDGNLMAKVPDTKGYVAIYEANENKTVDLICDRFNPNPFNPGGLVQMISATFRPDGNKVLIASDIGAKIFDIKEKRESKLVAPKFPNTAFHAAYSPDGKIVVAWLNDVSVYDSEENFLFFLTQQDRPSGWCSVKYVTFSPDGTKIAVSSYSQTFIHDATDGALLFTIPVGAHGDVDSGIASVAFSPDGKKLVIIGEHFRKHVVNSFGRSVEFRKTVMWDLLNNVELFSIEYKRVMKNSVAFSADGNMVITHFGKNVSGWDAKTGDQLWDTRFQIGNDKELNSISIVNGNGEYRGFMILASNPSTLFLNPPYEMLKPTSAPAKKYVDNLEAYGASTRFAYSYDDFISFLQNKTLQSRQEVQTSETSNFCELSLEAQSYIKALLPGRPMNSDVARQ
jgi:WD40 repeat protein